MRSCCGLEVLSATLIESPSFDLFSHLDDVLAASEVDVGGGEVVQGLVIAAMIVVVDEAGDHQAGSSFRAECGSSARERSFETMVDIMKSAEAPRPFVVVDNEAKVPVETLTPLENARVLYDRCPLYDGAEIPHQIEAKVTNHPLYKPQLPPTMKWCACSSCGHVFTEGYFTPEACEIVFSATHGNQKVGNDAENQRRVSAKMVERVARYVPNGDWLDIGVGNGSLLFTAAEWGYGAVGTDLRTENVEKLRNLGFEAYSDDIENIAAIERFSVVSMADVLEHVPFPRRSLARRASHDAARRRAIRLDAEYGFDHLAGPRCDGYEPLLGRTRALPQLYQSPVSAVARIPRLQIRRVQRQRTLPHVHGSDRVENLRRFAAARHLIVIACRYSQIERYLRAFISR